MCISHLHKSSPAQAGPSVCVVGRGEQLVELCAQIPECAPGEEPTLGADPCALKDLFLHDLERVCLQLVALVCGWCQETKVADLIHGICERITYLCTEENFVVVTSCLASI